MPFRAVFFDLGEIIVDESRQWGTWADWLGVPRHTFSAVFGAVIARGLDYREVFEVFRPGFDLEAERKSRAAVGAADSFDETNLYPDARPCLAALRGQGVRVGLAGNQTAQAELVLRTLDLPVDVIGTSDGWGVDKPSSAFFDRVVAEAGFPADEVLYVGDRLDNDIRPAQAAGLATALVRRGPWGHILRDADAEHRCAFRLDSLAELPDLVRASEWRIVPAIRSDAPEILTLTRACWVQEAVINNTVQIGALHESLSDVVAGLQAWDTYVVRDRGRLVGGVRGRATSEGYKIGRLMVVPDLQGRGLGRRLLAHIMSAAPAGSPFHLFTGKASLDNQRMYRAAGFELVGPSPSEPDAVIMRRPALADLANQTGAAAAQAWVMAKTSE